MPAVSQSCSLILFRLDPVPSLTMREENSTPIVCEDRTRPGECNASMEAREGPTRGFVTFVLHEPMQHAGPVQKGRRKGSANQSADHRWTDDILASAAGSQKNHLGEVIVHAPQFLGTGQLEAMRGEKRGAYLILIRDRRSGRSVRKAPRTHHGAVAGKAGGEEKRREGKVEEWKEEGEMNHLIMH